MKTQMLCLSVLAIVVALVAGCGGGGGDIATPPAGVPGGGVVVTDNPSQTMPFSEVQALPRGTELTVRLNRSGYEVRGYQCTLISAFVDTAEHLVQCQVPVGMTVGAGDSGSPVLYDGKVVGALAYGYDGDGRNFFAKSMDDMDEVNSYVHTAAASNRHPIGLAFQTNASERAVNFMRSMGHGNDQFVVTQSVIGTRGGVIEPTQAIAGQSVSVDYVRGDLINGGAVGTLTYKQPNGTWLAFGHPLDFTGQRSVPVSLASMDAMIDSVFGSFKQAHATKEPMGALVQDRQQGCLIDPSAMPATSPVIVKATVNGRETTYQHDLLRDGGSNAETYFCGLSIITSLDRALGQIARLGSSGTVTVKFEGGDEQTFGFTTPEMFTLGGTVYPPSDASSDVTRAAMNSIYNMANQNFRKSIESVTVEVEFHDWQAPIEEPGNG